MRRNEDQLRRIRAGTSAAMKRRAAARQCPACGRKNALVRVYEGDIAIGSVCRWCKHERPVAPSGVVR